MQFSKLGFLAAAVAATAACSNGMSTGGLDVEQTYIINLTQSAEVPAAKPTSASGGAEVLVYPSRIDFQLSAINIKGITSAAIHSGATGVAGPVVVTLFNPAVETGNVSGVFAVGSLDASNLPTGVSLDQLKALLLSGNAYINVHTLVNPGGEIRGQLVPGVPTATQ
jgi:CHRD domain-containing protein